MATKKAPPSEREIHWPAKLIISRKTFLETLSERIEKGRAITNMEWSINYAQVKDAYDKWNSWNEQYLKVSFNYEDNSYLSEYRNFGSITMRGGYGEPPEYQKIQEKKEDTLKKIKKIEILIEKTELIPVEISAMTHEVIIENNSLEIVTELCNGFHYFAQEIRHRYSGRETVLVNDEYDVQDVLRSLLKVYFKDVRSEDYAPSSAWGNSRIDLVLPNEEIIIETKMASEKLRDKDLWEQIAIDIVRYQNHPSYKTLLVFIYDKWDNIRNKRGLITDLEKQSKNWKTIKVIINPL